MGARGGSATTIDRPSGPPFVGRAAVRADVVGHLVRDHPAGPPFVLVTGEAGVGKSALLEVVVRDDLPTGSTIGAAGLAAGRAEGPAPIVVVDDASELDDAALAALADHPGPALVGLRRPGPPVRGPLARLLHAADQRGVLRTVDLEPLDAAAVAQLLEAHDLGSTPGWSRQIADAAAGNPRIALALARSGWTPTTAPPAWLIVPMFELSEEAEVVARLLSVLDGVAGEHLPLLAELLGADMPDAARAVDDLVELGVLSGDAGEFRFVHPIVRDALRGDLGAGEAWIVHRQVFDWLAQRPRTRRSLRDLARHALVCGGQGESVAVDALAAMGDDVAAIDPKAAEQWFGAAIGLMADDDPRWAALRTKRAAALVRLEQADEAHRLLEAAAERTDDPDLRARITVLQSECLLKQHAVPELLALSVSEPGAFASSARLASIRSAAAASAGLLGDAMESLRVALRLATDGSRQNMRDTFFMTAALCVMGQFDDLDAQIAELQRAIGEPAETELTYSAAAVVAALRGDGRACASFADASRSLAEASGNPFAAQVADLAGLARDALLGNWPVVVEPRDAPDPDSVPSIDRLTMVFFEAEVLSNQGSWTAARALLGTIPAPADSYWVGLLAWVRGGIELLSGRPDIARGILEQGLERGLVPGALGPLLSRMGEVAIVQGDQVLLDSSLARLDDLAADGGLDHATAVRWHCLHGFRHHDRSRFDAGAAVAAQHDLRFLHAVAQLRAAEVGLDDGAELTEAYRRFGDLGAVPWRRLAAETLRRQQRPVPRQRRVAEDTLTESESAVARLIGEGRANKEIAAALSLSTKTVEKYLTRIYAKVGCESRLELARAYSAGDLARWLT